MVHCNHASISHSYGDMAPQKLDGRTHARTQGQTLRWFYTLSNAMRCIVQTKTLKRQKMLQPEEKNYYEKTFCFEKLWEKDGENTCLKCSFFVAQIPGYYERNIKRRYTTFPDGDPGAMRATAGPAQHSCGAPLGKNFWIFLNGIFLCTLYFWATAGPPNI